MNHQPVMLAEMLAALPLEAGKRIVDCTFGAGGYSKAILQNSEAQVLALDRDPSVEAEANAVMAANANRFSFCLTEFSGLEAAMHAQGWEQVDGIVLDVGVSSMQLDQSERGFSFMRDGPLDMRMSRFGVSAADVVNQLGERDLIQIFRVYGEEKRARRAAQAILSAREIASITTTGQLAELIEQAFGGKRSRIHPATKVFQALRIFINDELGELAKVLLVAERVLKPTGKLVVVAFHSLEDRLVKSFLRERSEAPSRGSRFAPLTEQTPFYPSFIVSNRKVTLPSSEETARNPRSRSARLRWAERSTAAAFGTVPQLAPMPTLALVEAGA